MSGTSRPPSSVDSSSVRRRIAARRRGEAAPTRAGLAGLEHHARARVARHRQAGGAGPATVAAPSTMGTVPGLVTVTDARADLTRRRRAAAVAVDGDGGRRARRGSRVPAARSSRRSPAPSANAGLATISGSAGGGSATSPPSTPSEANCAAEVVALGDEHLGRARVDQRGDRRRQVGRLRGLAAGVARVVLVLRDRTG